MKTYTKIEYFLFLNLKIIPIDTKRYIKNNYIKLHNKT